MISVFLVVLLSVGPWSDRRRPPRPSLFHTLITRTLLLAVYPLFPLSLCPSSIYPFTLLVLDLVSLSCSRLSLPFVRSCFGFRSFVRSLLCTPEVSIACAPALPHSSVVSKPGSTRAGKETQSWSLQEKSRRTPQALYFFVDILTPAKKAPSRSFNIKQNIKQNSSKDTTSIDR